MDLSQLGDLVKQKYQQYVQHPSEELGRRVVAKFPEYASRLTQTGIISNANNSIDQLAQALAQKNIANRNLNTETEKLLKTRGSTGFTNEVGILPIDKNLNSPKWTELNETEQRYLIDKGISVVGGITSPLKKLPDSRAYRVALGRFEEAIQKTKNIIDLNQSNQGLEELRKIAQEQLTPEEYQKVKFFNSDSVLNKIKQRIDDQFDYARPSKMLTAQQTSKPVDPLIQEAKKYKPSVVKNKANYRIKQTPLGIPGVKRYEISSGGKEIGEVVYSIDNHNLYIDNIQIDDEYQRMGIGTGVISDLLKKEKATLTPSSNLTESGQRLQNKFLPEEQSIVGRKNNIDSQTKYKGISTDLSD
jgi:hypothetical protein